MKYLTIILIHLFPLGTLLAQPGIFRYNTSQTYILELELGEQQERAVPLYRTVNNSGDTALLGIQEIGLEDADLVFLLNLEEYGKEFTYSINLSYQPAASSESTPAKPRLDREYSSIIADTRSIKITWEDALAYDLDFGVPYLIDIQVRLEGFIPVDCEAPPPSFTFKENYWPHVAGLGAGAILIGLGQVALKNSDNDYTRYENTWRSYLDSSGDPAFKENAQPFFEEARENHRTYRALTYAGIGVIALDAAWFTYRLFKHKKDVRLYERYCQKEGLAITPATFSNGLSGFSPAVGLSVAFHF